MLKRVLQIAAALWFGTAFVLPAAAQTPASAPASTPLANAQPTAKIIVQATHAAGIDVAAFTADGRHLVTASGLARELLVWNVATNHLVDRLRLPSAAGSTADYVQLHQMRLSADGRTLRIDGEVLDQKAPDLRAARAYVMDVNSRRISTAAPGPLPPIAAGENWQSMMQRRVLALSAIYAGDTSMSRAEAARVLPALPRTPDGRYQLVRTAPAWALQQADGRLLPAPQRTRLVSIEDADLSPDDRRIALLHTDISASEDTTIIDVMDISNGRYFSTVRLAGIYDRVRWTGNNQYVAMPQDDQDDPLDDAAQGQPPPVVRIDADTGRQLASNPSRCFMALLADGSLIGGGLGNCRSGAGNDTSLQRLAGNGWVTLKGFEMPDGAHIRTIAASPDGRRLFIATRLADGDLAMEIADPATGAVAVLAMISGGAEVTMSGFSADGRKVWLAANGLVREWTPDQSTPDGGVVFRDFNVTTLMPSRFATRGNRLMIGGFMEEMVQIVDLTTGKALRPVAFPGAAALGFMRTRPFIWAASTIDGLRIWDVRSGRVVLTTAFLPGQKFVSVAPDGRYDTNLGPDSESFRWLISDRPFQSLAPQTLMRDFYLPQMFTKLLDCAAANNCATVLKPLPSLATLNRQLPIVRITGATATSPGEAEVSIEVADNRDPATGRTSGVYGVKLLMNNREIARQPDDPYAPVPKTLAEWRTANFSAPGDDQGRRYWSFKVPLPSDGKPIEFSAYSFNADRVKSDTARLNWTAPRMTPRTRRAFVLTIGVNDYVEPRLALNYAVPDARLIASRLANIPGYQMRRASLTTGQLPNGQIRHVSSDDMSMALSILAGFKGDGVRDTLRAAGHDVSALDEATPDDIVIISYSGHGFADATGSFALVPSNARWGINDPAPDPDTVVDADDLTMWLRAINAGEIAFIIDACHSGAAVDTPDFKPGPMGDPGLGQLAFDKGLRILAATQANDLAMENALLGQGVLSAALGQGLPTSGAPPADVNRDGRVRLDEWLRYAVAEMPAVNERARRGGGQSAQRGVLLEMTAPSVQVRAQEASLFDFNTEPSPVVLRGQP